MLTSARRVQDNQAWSMTMTPETPENPLTEGVRSLEVRWIFPGQLETAVAEWFGRFPAETESREDAYLLDPQLRRLSVKVRGGAALEVKVYRGSPGIQATGPVDLLRGALQATAALVFAQPLPGSAEPGLDESWSYAKWLCQQSGAESYAAWKAPDDRVLMLADQQ